MSSALTLDETLTCTDCLLDVVSAVFLDVCKTGDQNCKVVFFQSCLPPVLTQAGTISVADTLILWHSRCWCYEACCSTHGRLHHPRYVHWRCYQELKPFLWMLCNISKQFRNSCFRSSIINVYAKTFSSLFWPLCFLMFFQQAWKLKTLEKRGGAGPHFWHLV